MEETHPAPDRLMASSIEFAFNQCFQRLNVILQGGGAEPFYRPHGPAGEQAVLTYRADFAASALHEISHWCIAGIARRALPDFGYWYNPDGRTAIEQGRFYQVEVKPQALEWIFSDACGVPFNLSADNLDGQKHTEGRSDLDSDFKEFAKAVAAQKKRYLEFGLPPRAHEFVKALDRAELLAHS